MGSSAAYACKKAHIPFLLIESNHSVITSSWGESRILRLSYGDPLYVRMMQRSYVLWRDLEKDAEKSLLQRKPVLSIFDHRDSGSMETMRDQMNAFGSTSTPFDILRDASQLNVQLNADEVGLLQQDGACIMATEALSSLRDLVSDNMVEDRIVRIDVQRKIVVGESGSEYPYDKLVLCAGAWTNKILRNSNLSELPYVASLEQFVYYDFFPQYSRMGNIPIILEGFKYKNGRIGGAYVMPHIEDGVPGVKMGMHCNGRIISSDDFVVPESVKLERLPNERIGKDMFLNDIVTDLDTYMEHFARRFVRGHLPTVDSSKVSSYGRCIYQACTLQDGRFLIGLHPENPDIVIACGFTGEGFKFAPVIGEFVVAEVTKSSSQPVFADMRNAFRLDRV